MSIPCGTATDPQLCGACPNRASFLCQGCNNMPYCSKACQDGDHHQHKMLCDTFKDFQEEHRPSPNHRRVIFFPADEVRPRFVWLKYEGSGKFMDHDLHDLARFIPEEPTASGMFFDSHRELRRQYQNTFWMQKIGNYHLDALMPPNRSLIELLGAQVARWRGPIICMAPTKYRLGIDPDERDLEDQDEEEVLIPYDLDTTSLAIHVGFLRFVANYGHLGRAYSIEAQGIGDGYDP